MEEFAPWKAYLEENFRDANPLCGEVDLVPLGRVLADVVRLGGVGVEHEVGGVLPEGGLVLGQPLLLRLAVGVASVLNAENRKGCGDRSSSHVLTNRYTRVRDPNLWK